MLMHRHSMLYSTLHELEHWELNFHFLRWICRLNNMHSQDKLRSFNSETCILNFHNVEWWEGMVGVDLLGFWVNTYLNLKYPPSLNVSIRWQQNQTSATPVVDCNSKLSLTEGDQVKLSRVCWQCRNKTNTRPWVSSSCGDIPNLSRYLLSLSSI